MRFYKYRDLQIATDDFKQENKIGQGSFGSVYKGTLKDSLVVAIKVLSADSRQGLREFLTEITVISDIQHENLVKLHGYCVEGDHRILVWRVNSGKLSPVPVVEQRKLYSGDCHTVQYIYSANGGEERLFYIWLGNKSSAEDRADAVSLTNVIVNASKVEPVMARIVENKEPTQFFMIFQTLIMFKGGMSSEYKSFIAENGVVDETYNDKNTALFRIQGTNRDNMQAVQVDQVSRSLNSSSCYILKAEGSIFTWLGNLSTTRDHDLLYGMLELINVGNGNCSIKFTWEIRKKICIGVAKGLAYLHEEVQPHVIHRDIKASNILLDEDYTPKISDFGLAKLFPSHLTHVSTRIAGTQGYLAPEYAIRGQLTRKADIYSFGILLLEIITGRPNQNRRLPVEDQYLLERLWQLYREGELETLVDSSIGEDDIEEACRYIKVGLLCTQSLPKSRPSMSNVLKMLQNVMDLNEKDLSDPGLLSELMNFKTVKNNTSGSSSSISGKHEDSPMYGNTTTSYATMTFTTISDR